MAKKDKKIIEINANDINLKEILTQGPEAGYINMLAGMGIIKVKLEEVDQITKPYDDAAKFFKGVVENADYNSIVKNLIEKGVLTDTEQQLVVQVTVPQEDGSSIIKDITLKSKEQTNFMLDDKIYSEIDKKSLFTKLEPEVFDRYLKIDFNQKAMAEDLAAGTLPDIFRDYCSMSPAIKATTSITKGK